MRLTFKENAIEYRLWEEKREMVGFLAGCDAGTLILGEDADPTTGFYSLVISYGWAKESRFGIGICTEGHGLVPYLIIQPENELLILGFNREVVGISVVGRKVLFKIALDYLFHSFVTLRQWKMILAFHETGVVAMNEEGHEIWRYDADIVVDCMIEKQRISLVFMDTPPVNLNILDGTLME